MKENQYKKVVEGLGPAKGPSEATENAAGAKADPAPRGAAQGRQGGRTAQGPKRYREGMTQVNASIPLELKARAFENLKRETDPKKPRTLSDLIEVLLQEWVEEKGRA